MREIKFRAWDSERSEMAKVVSLGEEDITLQDSEGRIWDSVTGYIAYPMQYTGLKDKSGVEIYEGDVVKAFEKPYDDFPRNNEVVLSLGSFKLRCIRPVGSDNAKFDYEFVSDIPIFNYHETSLEVIGNIYENPELLEGNA